MHIAHVTIKSAKKDESVAFYEKYCGLKVVRTVGDRISFLSDAEGATNVEIIDDSGDAVSATGISIGFSVADVEGYRAELEAAGLEPTGIISPGPGVSFFFVNDPNGVQIQFIG